ncbi:MAG: DUF1634 domain-containing protein [Planctomycetia bacterium]|nr:DUF1634 domain-containing protein [Planctomycetia bacterium]
MTESPTQQRRLARAVHWGLSGGLYLSAALLVAGLMLSMAGHATPTPHHPLKLRPLIAASLNGDGTAVINLGLVLLMATPVLRVLVLGIGWLGEKDWRFALVSLIVLTMLCVSIVWGTG